MVNKIHFILGFKGFVGRRGGLYVKFGIFRLPVVNLWSCTVFFSLLLGVWDSKKKNISIFWVFKIG